MPSLLTLHVADDPGLWARLGFTVTDGRVRIASTDIAFSAPIDGQPTGIVAWTLDLVGAATTIDGLATRSETTTRQPEGAPTPHANRTTGIDHLVVSTPDLERTVAVLEGLGFACRRRRDGAAYGSQKMRQAFFWLESDDATNSPGRVLLEVVGPADPDLVKADQPAAFFGLALVSADLDATCNYFGDLMKPPTEAVQAGRQIATLSSRAGCKVALAFMSPQRTVPE